MDKFPVYFKGKSVGEMIVEKGDHCAWFTVQVNIPKKEDLLCVWVLGNKTDLRLGILEPTEFGREIRRKFSERMILPLGTIQGAEVRAVKKECSAWEPILDVDKAFLSSRLRNCFRGQQGLLVRQHGKTRQIAVPYDKGNCFSAIELFCFAKLVLIGTREYLVILFNEKDEVLFSG